MLHPNKILDMIFEGQDSFLAGMESEEFDGDSDTSDFSMFFLINNFKFKAKTK